MTIAFILRQLVYFFATIVLCSSAVAGVTADRTRIIVMQGAMQQVIQLVNLNAYPVLVQAWVDDGKLSNVPEEVESPIFTNPPVFKMAPQEHISLRLINSGSPLPQDRESLFWLNLYEIPPTPTIINPDETVVAITMRTQLKLFVRPEKLPFPATQLASKLIFSISKNAMQMQLSIKNPTPYFATMHSIQLEQAGSTQNYSVDMIAPFDEVSLSLDKSSGLATDQVSVQFSLVNDEGNLDVVTQTVKVKQY